MYVVYGSSSKAKIVKPIGTMTCPNCRHLVEMGLAKENFKIHIFYIPIFFITKFKFLFCPNCGIAKKLTGAEYKEYKNN